MGPVVDIVANQKQISQLDVDLVRVKNGANRVLTRSLNKVGGRGRTKIVRFLAERSGKKYGDIKKRNVLYRGANFRRLEVKIMLRGRSTPVSQLKPRQDSQGVTYMNPLTGQRELIEKAFEATMSSGHRGVFRRMKLGIDAYYLRQWGGLRGRIPSNRPKALAKVTKEGWAWRLPIEEMEGPSIIDAFLPHIPSFQQETAAQLKREIEVQTDLVLKRIKG